MSLPSKFPIMELYESAETNMGTESRNPKSIHLSEMETADIVRLMNEEDETVIHAVRACINEIAALTDCYARTINGGGRVFYLGAGTSGGLALIDAAEVPPTFGMSPDRVIALTAEEAISYTNDAEDSTQKARAQLESHHCGSGDLVIGIAASGSTPYVAEGLRYAKSVGALTGAVACNKDSVIGKIADYKVEADTGAEVLTGSTRLKAGTAQKMILNMMSTAAMVKCGKVMSNYMVDVQAMNAKLVKRATSIVMELTGCDAETANEAMRRNDNHAKRAIEWIQNKETTGQTE